MKLYSTNNHDLKIDFQSAVFNSMPQDKGLYMPVEIPALDQDFIQHLDRYTLREIAYKVSSALLQDDIPANDLKAIIDDAINFEAPLHPLDEDTYVLELFHGPSLAFKDFGARFMSRVMAYFLKDNEQLLDVLVATSGDTGGAVALGFLGVPNTRVTILYPKGKVSEIQELQLCSNGQNIRAIEIDGTFDDCQHLVKQAFADDELNSKMRLTSANSINIARLIPQTFYYFNAVAQLFRKGQREVVFAVPSGNFGNIAAGLLAYKMGLPVKQFIAATNANDTVPRFLETGIYETRPSVQTYANAMDVGAPSNWVRIMALFNDSREQVKELVKSYRYTDEQTVQAIADIYQQFNYVACPHTAIAWLAVQEYRRQQAPSEDTFVFLSTAHPCKFPDIFPAEIAAQINIPEQVDTLRQKEKIATAMAVDFDAFKSFLLTAD
ncbi:threonine synthase [Pedobacter cryoconitis]|uniref:Threonine synthase n=1 Tax=Pedobacter cryoconitis TaxID=188932 RepID=A0A7W8YZ00_9SPHI|nr:threonine synthase [Pedobacter cryoconitis]MBB5624150.1 threonine synthase [Pedobacter cryoconitis]MBB5647395.1 threonine synthase [Pedobacter cryoconitis]